MGYESKFYVVEKSNLSPESDTGLTWAQEIACFDMCKMGYESQTLKLVGKSKYTELFIYADDGNTKIMEDCYGEKLKEIGLSELIEALEKDDDGYRRIKPFVAFLKTIRRGIRKWKSIRILHYGH